MYKYMKISVCAAIQGYCTATPQSQIGVIWPASIWKSMGEIVAASCANGYNFSSSSGLPRVTCSAGGINAGSGVWTDRLGNCTGSPFFHSSILFPPMHSTFLLPFHPILDPPFLHWNLMKIISISIITYTSAPVQSIGFAEIIQILYSNARRNRDFLIYIG